jgi:MSHA biogenesis protein MshL
MLLLPLPELAGEENEGARLESFVGRDTQVQEILLSMFRDSDINILLDADVSGSLTFDIKNTTVESAFEALLRSLDLSYEWDGSFLRVQRLVRRSFDVDILSSSSESAAGGGADLGQQDQGDSSPWSSMEEDLGLILGDEGSVLINDIAGIVQVEARPSTALRVRDYLDSMVRRVNNQISIEARILEVGLSDEFALGVNWQLLPEFFNSDELGTLAGGSMVTQTAASGGTALNVGILKTDNWELFVDALEAQGQVRVLASPRVSTMNNVPASLRVVDQLPVIDREIIDSLGGLRTQYDVRFVDAGINLQVTPQIGSDGMITVRVNPDITNQTGTVTTPDGLVTEPILATRETSSSVRVPNGQSIVIGGLRTTRKTEELNGIPFLADIPLLGTFFRSTVQTRLESELIIVLVPRIIERSWMDEELQRATDRLIALRRPFKLSSLDLEGFRTEDWKSGLLQGEINGAYDPATRLEIGSGDTPDSRSLTVTRKGLAGRLIDRAAEALQKRNITQAIEDLEQASRLDPESAKAQLYAGVLHSQRGHFRLARTHLEKASAILPDDVLLLTARGAVELAAGSPYRARKFLELAHAQAENPVSASNLGAALLATQDFAAARELLEPFSGDLPAELSANLAFAQMRLGERDKARESLRRATVAGADPRDPRILALAQELAEESESAEEDL